MQRQFEIKKFLKQKKKIIIAIVCIQHLHMHTVIFFSILELEGSLSICNIIFIRMLQY